MDLKTLLSAQEIESCGIDPQLRPETLTPAQFGLLAAHVLSVILEARCRAIKKSWCLLDLSDDSEQVAIAGRDMAANFGAAMVVLHVVEFVPVEPMGESLMPTVQIEGELLERSRDKLAATGDAARSSSTPPRASKPATPRRRSCASRPRRQPI